jgi:inner membrane protein
MTDTQSNVDRAVSYVSRSVTLKLIVIGVLMLLLLIPAVMIQNLIEEREQRRDSVVSEISQKWGGRQTITGPFISVPYKCSSTDVNGVKEKNTGYFSMLPETLSVTGKIYPEKRHRSLFETVVYSAKLKLSGKFKIPPLNQLNINPDDVMWEKSSVSTGITDMRGIENNIDILFDDTVLNTDPGLKNHNVASAGVTAAIDLSAQDSEKNFSFDLNLKGSERIDFIPVGETTRVSIESAWPSPSFDGAFLPDKSDISEEGFSAEWKVLHLNRNYPQLWTGTQPGLEASSFGVRLILTADIYQKSMRLAKYALMFLFFTFAAFFFAEVINKQKIHPIQYVLVGVAILIFYTLVLSISEHIRFNFAYILSAVSVTLIISGYAKAISGSRFALTIMGILAVLYGYLFIVLQMENYSLILGSVGLFVITASVMYLTRRINWYRVDASPVNNFLTQKV